MDTYLGFQCCIKDGTDLWFSSFRGNGLFRFNGETIEHIISFEEKGIQLFSDIKKYKEKLFFVPFMANKIYIYNLLSKKMESVCYKNYKTDDFAFSILHKNYLYMFPSHYEGILRLNCDTLNIQVIDNWINKDFRKYQLSEDRFFGKEYVNQDNVLYVSFCNAHAVLEFHLEDEKSILHDVGNQGYSSIVSDGRRFWMAPWRRGGIVAWDSIMDEVVEYRDFPGGFLQGSFIGSYYEEGYVWMFPESANMVLKVNTDNGEIFDEQLFSSICNFTWSKYSVWGTSFIYIGKESEWVRLCSGKSGEMILFYPKKRKMERFHLLLPDKTAKNYYEERDSRYLLFRKQRFRNQVQKGRAFVESKNYSFREYMEDLELENEDKRRNDLGIGKTIYKNIALYMAGVQR